MTNLGTEARSLAHYLSRIEDRLMNLNPHDVDKRYKLFTIAMDKCTRFEGKLGTTGISLLNIMERNQLSTGEELYDFFYSELPVNIDGKNQLSNEIRGAAQDISEIKDGKAIYQEKSNGDISLATNQQLQAGFDRLIKACYKAAAKASIK